MTTTDMVGLYVLESNSISELSDVKEYKIGILEDIGRGNTDRAIEEIYNLINEGILIKEFESTVELVKGLVDGQVDLILLNSAYLVLLDEDSELTKAVQEFKMIWSFEIQRDLKISSALASNIFTQENRIENNTESTMVSETEPVTEFFLEDSAHKENAEQKSIQDEKSISNTPFVVYISGNDSDGELRSNGRSDVNILMAVNPNTKNILLVNTPRDYYVQLAGIDEMDKLTHAGIYGVDTSMNTLERVYNVPINYYIRLNFSGFMDIIDALGGITVESDVEFTVADWHYVVGENDLSGIEALAFARERYSFITGDRQRGKNQQAVIKGVIKKICSPVILTRYSDLIKASMGAIETNMSMEDIATLVKMQFEDNANWNIDSVSVDGSDAHDYCYSLKTTDYVMLPNDESISKAKSKLNNIMFRASKGNCPFKHLEN